MSLIDSKQDNNDMIQLASEQEFNDISSQPYNGNNFTFKKQYEIDPPQTDVQAYRKMKTNTLIGGGELRQSGLNPMKNLKNVRSFAEQDRELIIPQINDDDEIIGG